MWVCRGREGERARNGMVGSKLRDWNEKLDGDFINRHASVRKHGHEVFGPTLG